jgi:putative oxidoreductase
VNTGLLLVRVVIAMLLFAHATQKLRGWFDGPGLKGASSIGFTGPGRYSIDHALSMPWNDCGELVASLQGAGALALALSLASVMGPGCCHEEGTTWHHE